MIGKKTIRTLFYTTSGVSVLFTGLLLLPVLLWSFGSQWLFPDLLPQKFSGDRWMEIFLGTGGGRTGRAFFNSFTIALAVTLLNAVIAMPVARYLSRLRGNARIVADLLVLIPLIPTGYLGGARHLHIFCLPRYPGQPPGYPVGAPHAHAPVYDYYPARHIFQPR